MPTVSGLSCKAPAPSSPSPLRTRRSWTRSRPSAEECSALMDDLIQPDSPDLSLSVSQEDAPGFDEIRHGFELDGQHLLLAAGTFSELASRSPICPLPDSPPWFAGFINHRGHTVPVYDLPYMARQERLDLRKKEKQ
eukprot:Anaeramoba_flamelloidesc35324_g1_i3.p1 GENE.c35324_g1_i3~~c35324_g1_i3.p1  ORF type:complete len:137 (-),score=12.01 c35324_g1_i3:108-518(-)